MPRVMCVYMGPTREPGACEIYRGNMPLYWLGIKNKRWVCEWTFFEDWYRRYKERGMEYLVETFKRSDLFVFPRMFSPSEEATVHIGHFFNVLRQMGKRIIYEVDDDYTNEYRHVINGSAMEIASWCDAITVTTPYLADRMAKRTRRPVYILPNMLDARMWQDGKVAFKREGWLRIGLTGSPTHKEDWRVLRTVLPGILADYPNVELLLGGYHPDYMEELSNTIRLPGVAYPDYTQVIRSCDIVLAPVDPDDRFNLGKSPIKAVEGMGARAFVIATNNEIYRIAVRDGKTGLLVEHTPEAWDRALRKAIEDGEFRQRVREAAYRYAWGHYDISREAHRWGRVYDKVLSAAANPIKMIA